MQSDALCSADQLKHTVKSLMMDAGLQGEFRINHSFGWKDVTSQVEYHPVAYSEVMIDYKEIVL